MSGCEQSTALYRKLQRGSSVERGRRGSTQQRTPVSARRREPLFSVYSSCWSALNGVWSGAAAAALYGVRYL